MQCLKAHLHIMCLSQQQRRLKSPSGNDTITFLGRAFALLLGLFSYSCCSRYTGFCHFQGHCAFPLASSLCDNLPGILFHDPPYLSFTFYHNKPLFTHFAACFGAPARPPLPSAHWTRNFLRRERPGPSCSLCICWVCK